MIWIGICLLGVIALLPALISFRRTTLLRDERETALVLHQAQLAELERDLVEGMIAPSEHDSARLEIQRRLLGTDMLPAFVAGQGASTGVITAALIALPVAAIGLYLTVGHPSLPAQPLAPRLVALQHEDHRNDAIIDRLRDQLKQIPAGDPSLFQGYVLLGQAEAGRDHYAAAAQAWRSAIEQRFDPEVAARAAEAQMMADGGHISPETADLYRRALDAAPPNAPWRMTVQQRIAQSEHQ
ncbi:c-type cytochrome biogenesis protein CcmI [Komagataeibacter intermedius]|uniref:Cytochrome C n=2 Tax=Komagataeibacter intermedius TaxID=66229 RepID=A0A0N0MHI2_9PROT|nr:c-type cytochrome biogenesis protein CcmI [Komagataeibacter intermedius]KPH89134.1 cytochrome C [Komagataeibacter intermedius AF2]MCF3635201.1 c-type cytochrome biogenesis protein CcmI [Komagataeibacter intermedius]GAN87415.1 cytochrome c-type biogenesis protein CcmH/CycH [Komagataeibacter intermedius TF2]GBQ73325.1 cytochrome c-type biogenesis protein CycH [Komagataeibacter intermedius NRIC 0521]